ncbi:hypothetical protein AKH13_07640 [Vibrio parahaemolyticus]|nr:hypothetical protein [Vibrio parahaemolyticus]OCP92231.1 hypothetical protein AKH13_07640 [Vibrio parahaemolyticus]OCP94653.1 hypothetical protein AKH14_21535 [Vibrio parahaemolyticus]
MNEIKKIDSELSDVLAGLDKTFETLNFELIGELRNEELIKIINTPVFILLKLNVPILICRF